MVRWRSEPPQAGRVPQLEAARQKLAVPRSRSVAREPLARMPRLVPPSCRCRRPAAARSLAEKNRPACRYSPPCWDRPALPDRWQQARRLERSRGTACLALRRHACLEPAGQHSQAVGPHSQIAARHSSVAAQLATSRPDGPAHRHQQPPAFQPALAELAACTCPAAVDSRAMRSRCQGMACRPAWPAQHLESWGRWLPAIVPIGRRPWRWWLAPNRRRRRPSRRLQQLGGVAESEPRACRCPCCQAATTPPPRLRTGTSSWHEC